MTDLWADPDFVRDELEANPPQPVRPTPALRLPPGMAFRAHDMAGVGHLLPRGATRYLCNRMAIAERFAWPVKSHCPWCVSALETGR